MHSDWSPDPQSFSARATTAAIVAATTTITWTNGGTRNKATATTNPEIIAMRCALFIPITGLYGRRGIRGRRGGSKLCALGGAFFES